MAYAEFQADIVICGRTTGNHVLALKLLMRDGGPRDTPNVLDDCFRAVHGPPAWAAAVPVILCECHVCYV